MTAPARQTFEYLTEKTVKLMSRCPYPPDLHLTPFLFPNVKQNMHGQRFSSPQEVVEPCF